MSESSLYKPMMALASSMGARLLRNNTGKLPDHTGRWVEFGLGVGSSDLIGFKPVTITPDMVGRRIAVFTAVECKTRTGRIRPEQSAFIAMVNSFGGIAGIARSTQDLQDLLDP